MAESETLAQTERMVVFSEIFLLLVDELNTCGRMTLSSASALPYFQLLLNCTIICLCPYLHIIEIHLKKSEIR